MTLTNEQKLTYYEYAIYEIKESLLCELEELTDDDSWLKSPSLAFRRAKMVTQKEVLNALTWDSMWNLPLEELRNILLPDILVHNERGELGNGMQDLQRRNIL